MAEKTAVIILCHGSKLKKANSLVLDVIKAIKKRLGLNLVRPAYLQFSQPDLSASIKYFINRKCGTIVVVPFFLFNGNHVTRDIPAALKNETAKYPKIKILYARNIGGDARISQIVIDRIKEAEKWL